METLDSQLKESPGNNSNAVIKLGDISGLILVLISFILFFTNSTYEPWAKWISTAVMFCLIVFSQKILSDGFDKISFGKIFGMGFKITLIITLLSMLYMVIYTNVLDVNFNEKVVQVARESMEKKGTLSEEQIEAALEMSKKFMTPAFMYIMLIVSNLIFGSLFSVIGAAVFKKE